MLNNTTGVQSAIDALSEKTSQIATSAGKSLATSAVQGVGSAGINVSSFSTTYTPGTTGTLTVAGCFSGTVGPGLGVNIELASGVASTPFGPSLVAESGGTIGHVNGSPTYQIACTAGVPIILIVKGVSPGNTFTGGACSLTIVENQTAS